VTILLVLWMLRMAGHRFGDTSAVAATLLDTGDQTQDLHTQQLLPKPVLLSRCCTRLVPSVEL